MRGTIGLLMPALAALLVTAVVGAEGDNKSKGGDGKVVTFSHATDGPSKSKRADLKPGERLAIKVTDTATNCFNYDVEKVEFAPQEGQGVGDREKTIVIHHDEAYGGYIVQVVKKAQPVAGCATETSAAGLKDATFIVIADTDDVEVAFGGGFTMSGLTDDVYASREQLGTDVVFRDKDAEDDVRLGVAALIHVYGKRWPKGVPALTFGLGISESSDATYYAGPFWRIGKQMFVGGGVAFGAVDRLPAGVRAGDEITDPNVLSDLDSRTEAAAFFGVSYTFLGGKAALEKPFVNAKGATQTGVSDTLNNKPVQECASASAGADFTDPQEQVRLARNGATSIEIEGTLKCNLKSSQALVLIVEDAQGNAVDTIESVTVEDRSFYGTAQVSTAGSYVVKAELREQGQPTVPSGNRVFEVESLPAPSH